MQCVCMRVRESFEDTHLMIGGVLSGLLNLFFSFYPSIF